MSQRHTLLRTGLAIGALLLAAIGSARLCYAVGERLCGCAPSTPCACAADGICRPKRDSWGHYKTKWRPWPGDPTDRTPEAADQTAQDSDVPPLDDFETPPAIEEDLRAPKKRDKPSDDDAAAPQELPGENPGQLLPAPGALPGAEGLDELDPFGNLPAVPKMEDAPPALPASLRQAAVKLGTPRLSIQASQETSPQVIPAAANMPAQHADWQQTDSRMLVNPAASVIEPANAPLQQAVYYEATSADQQ